MTAEEVEAASCIPRKYQRRYPGNWQLAELLRVTSSEVDGLLALQEKHGQPSAAGKKKRLKEHPPEAYSLGPFGGTHRNPRAPAPVR